MRIERWMAASILTAIAAVAVAAETAVGTVFHDRDANGRREPGEEGIAGVRVSNGEAVVVTNQQGVFRLPVEDGSVVFVTQPDGWKSTSESPVPYYVHRPQGSPALRFAGVPPTGALPESLDFGLAKVPSRSKYDVIMLGDPQMPNLDRVDTFAHEFAANLIGSQAAFGIALGDIASDNLAVYPAVRQTFAKTGLPWYWLPGNHDRNYDVESEDLTFETWKAHFGPTYYSFDEGKAHFVVLEDIVRTGPTGYRGGIGPRQLAWLKNDLARTPKDRLIVLSMHIPLVESLDEKKEILAAVAPFRNSVSFGAHWHRQAYRFLGAEDGWPGREPHHSIVAGTSSGCWWGGELDQVGLPMALMSDGTPQGFIVLSIDGSRFKMRYQVSRRPADYQMNVFAPSVLPAGETEGAEVVANVFLGSERSIVEMRVGDGPWTPMAQEERVDPHVARIDELQKANRLPASGSAIGAGKSTHIWVGELPSLRRGTHVIEVRTTDVFGQTFVGRRFVRVS